MVGHLVRLKLRLLANGLKRSAWQVVLMILGLVYGLGLLMTVAGGLVYVSTQALVLRELVVVVAGAALVLAWCVVPLVAFGVDATMDPARFAPYPIRRAHLLTGLAVSGLVGVPGLMTVLAALGSAILWWREPAALVASLLGAVLAVATCVVGSRALTTALARVVVRRRVRELGAALVLIPMMFIGPAMSGLTMGASRIRAADMTPVVQAVGWTPFGAAWALAPDVASGRWWQALARLVVALATVAVAVLVWDRSLARALVDPPHDVAGRRQRGLGWFARVPASPRGAVVARCLTYWIRDPRYAMAVVAVPIFPVLFAVLGMGSGLVLAAGPLAGFLLGWSISSDISFDGPAFWVHVAAGVRGGVDRVGRVLAALVLGVPVVTVMTIACALFLHRPDAVAPLLGSALGTLTTTLGVSSVASALVVYRVRKAGENPFSTQQGATVPAMLTQLAGWTTVGLLCAPVTVLAVMSVAGHREALGWVTLAVGPALGTGLMALGVRLGGRTLDRTAPDLLRRLIAMA